jgi:thioredoxin-related protein
MTQKKENTQKYKSCSTGQPCSAAQYIAEIICIRKREKENKGSLEYKFWNKSQKDEYQIQIRLANKLIKKYDIESILHFLNHGSGKKTYSLGFLHSSKKFVIVSKYVDNGVKESHKLVEQNKNKPKKVIEVDKPAYKKRKSYGGNTLLTKIRKAGNG